MIAEVDDDKNGQLEYPEFLLLMSRKINTSNSQMDEEMKEAFFAFTTEGKQYIELTDLKRVLKDSNVNLSDEEVQIMFEGAESVDEFNNKLGKIFFKDFIKMMMAK